MLWELTPKILSRSDLFRKQQTVYSTAMAVPERYELARKAFSPKDSNVFRMIGYFSGIYTRTRPEDTMYKQFAGSPSLKMISP